MKVDVTVLDNRLYEFINLESVLQTWDSACVFSEGPVWNQKGFYFFSDIPKNAIYKIEAAGRKELFLANSGCKQKRSYLSEQIGSNGLAYNKEGELIICQHGDGALVKYTGDALQPVAVNYQNKRFNSPNDLVIHADGTIFFSDPPYGLSNQQLQPQIAQSKARIYAYRSGELLILSEAYQYPNGVCLSADGSKLYTSSNKSFERFVLEFETQTLTQTRTVAQENGDGIKCDPYENIYLCAKEGIVIIDNQGKRLGILRLPAIAANCCWGGAEGKDLFITARENIYLVNNFLL